MPENLQVKCVGQGGYGVVMLLKSYHPQIVMKEIVKNPNIDFQTELQVLKELSHPNIVKYVDRPSDFSYNGENLVIFMEFCENGSLKQVISDSTLIYSVATIAKWAEEIFYALVYLFQKKKVHRDIKSANIFLTRDHIVKIGDFGIVKEFSKTNHPGQPVGTFGYMAPEVLDKLVVDEGGYVNVHFSELKALLESMISLFDFEHYSHEIDEVNTAEMREEFEELRGFQNYKSTMKEVIKKFWDNMDLKLAPSMQELEAIEVIVPEISLFPAEYL